MSETGTGKGRTVDTGSFGSLVEASGTRGSLDAEKLRNVVAAIKAMDRDATSVAGALDYKRATLAELTSYLQTVPALDETIKQQLQQAVDDLSSQIKVETNLVKRKSVNLPVVGQQEPKKNA